MATRTKIAKKGNMKKKTEKTNHMIDSFTMECDRETKGTWRINCDYNGRPLTYYIPKDLLSLAGIDGEPKGLFEVHKGKLVLTIS